MGLAAKEESWLTLAQQIEFLQHLEVTCKADTYIIWAGKPSLQCKTYVTTILNIPLPSDDADDSFL